jgi:hypothetical protein
LAFQKVKFSLWGFSKFEFGPMGSFQYIGGVFGLDGIEDARGHSILAVGVMHT